MLRRLALGGVLTLTALGVACSDSGDEPTQLAASDSNALIRFTNTSQTPVEFLVDGNSTAALDAMSSSGYVEIPAGARSAVLRAADTAQMALNLELAADGVATLVASRGATGDFELALVQEVRDALAGGTVATVLFNTMGDASISGWSFRSGIGRPMAQGLESGEATAATAMDAQTNALAMDTDGDTVIDLWFEVASLPERSLTVLTMGDATPMLQLVDSAGNTVVIPPSDEVPQFVNLRANHFSPDAPAVSIFGRASGAADETAERLVETLSFEENTGFLKLAPALYDLDITVAGAPVSESVLAVPGADLEGGVSYTAVAYDELASIDALLLTEDFRETAEGTTRVRVVHTAAGVGTVNVLVRRPDGSDSSLIAGLDFGSAADAIELPSTQYTIGLDVDLDARSDLLFALPSLPEGVSLNVFALASEEGVSLVVQTPESELIQVFGEPAPVDTASVRAFHLSPDAPTVDILANGEVAFPGLSFGESSMFAAVPAGETAIAITPEGAGAEGAVLEATIPLAVDTFTTVVAFDELAAINALVLEDNLNAPADGEIRVRAAHTAVGVGQVDVLVIDGNTRTPLIEDLDFGSAADALELPAAAYTLGLDLDNDGFEELVFDLPELPAGLIANAFVVVDGRGKVRLALQTLDGVSFVDAREVRDPAELRVIHLSPDAPAVDAYLNGIETPLIEDLEFTGSTPYALINAGRSRISVAPANTSIGDSVIDASGIRLRSNRRYTVAAFNTLAEIEPLVLFDDERGLESGESRIRFVHTGVGVPDVDVFLFPAAGSVIGLGHDIEFGRAADATDVRPGDYTVAFDVNDDHVIDAAFDLPTLNGGTYRNVFAVTDSAGQLSIVLQ
ncbi:MAG: DUF4397 domain-containing protein [Myxococcota bacterium]